MPLRLALLRPALLLQLAYGGRLHGIIIVEVIIFALSSALQAVASWCGLSRARTPKKHSYSNSSVRAAALLRFTQATQSISASGGGGRAANIDGSIDTVERHRGRGRMIVDGDHT